MRISLAVPSISDFYFSRERMSSLGAKTAARLAEEAGHSCILFDFPLQPKKTTRLPLPDEFGYLSPFLLQETGPLSFFTNYQRLGPPPAECAQVLAGSDPDIILISCFAYGYSDDAIELAEAVKGEAPGVAIAVGGAGPSVLPEKFLLSPAIDFVLSGEAEVNLTAFLTEFADARPRYEQVPNLVWKETGSLQHSPAGQITTEQDLSWVCHMNESRRGRRRVSTALTRGCPRSCQFCSNHLCHGRAFRKLPLDRVKSGLDAVAGQSASAVQSAGRGARQSAGRGARQSAGRDVHINFEDDNLLADREYSMEVLRLARQRFDSPTFSAENGLDAGFLNEELTEQLVGLGFIGFNLSLGSIDEEILEREGRPPLRGRIATLTKLSAALGVPTVTYFICGLPGDSIKTIQESLIFLHSLPTKIGISLFYPVPGLEGFQDSKLFLSRPARLTCGSSAYPWNDCLSTRELVTAFRLARLLNLLGDARQSAVHEDLINRIRKERRLYTWSRGGKELMRVDGLDDGLAREVLTAIDC